MAHRLQESSLRTGFIQIEIVRYVDGLEQYCLSTWKGRQNEDCPAHKWVIWAMEFKERMALEEPIGQAVNVTKEKMYRFAMERYRKSIRGLVWMEDGQRAYVTYSNDPDQGEIEVDTVSIDTVGEEVARRMIGTYPEIWRPARREDRITALDKEDFRTGKTCKMCNKEIYSVEDVTEKEGIQYHGSCYYRALLSRSSRGECAVCKLQVLRIHERTKNGEGQYCHLNCWTMFNQIKALEKDVATMREELKSKEEKTYDHVHTQNGVRLCKPTMMLCLSPSLRYLNIVLAGRYTRARNAIKA